MGKVQIGRRTGIPPKSSILLYGLLVFSLTDKSHIAYKTYDPGNFAIKSGGRNRAEFLWVLDLKQYAVCGDISESSEVKKLFRYWPKGRSSDTWELSSSMFLPSALAPSPPVTGGKGWLAYPLTVCDTPGACFLNLPRGHCGGPVCVLPA